LPDLGLTSGDPWNAELYYENHTALRDKAGLSKFRNTLQSEMSKNLNDGWRFRGILRGSYDGVYDLNKNQYGEGAGGAVNMTNSYANAGPVPPLNSAGSTVPYGQGVVNNTWGNILFAPFASTFYNAYGAGGLAYGANNTNTGLQILGSGWHQPNSTTGLSFAVPVRPCNVDSRGCMDFGGYGNKTKNELAFSEFNDRLDFIREAYVTKTINMDAGQSTFLKIGRQQVVWGRTDLFRVLDVINPVDYSRNNIYDELQDIRIPMFIAQAEYRMGASENMQDRNLSVVWNFDQIPSK